MPFLQINFRRIVPVAYIFDLLASGGKAAARWKIQQPRRLAFD
jgi:hypothetical protein